MGAAFGSCAWLGGGGEAGEAEAGVWGWFHRQASSSSLFSQVM